MPVLKRIYKMDTDRVFGKKTEKKKLRSKGNGEIRVGIHCNLKENYMRKWELYKVKDSEKSMKIKNWKCSGYIYCDGGTTYIQESINKKDPNGRWLIWWVKTHKECLHPF